MSGCNIKTDPINYGRPILEKRLDLLSSPCLLHIMLTCNVLRNNIGGLLEVL